nr:MAG TPA: hypothetical protein [Caudoviricetes sp.]
MSDKDCLSSSTSSKTSSIAWITRDNVTRSSFCNSSLLKIFSLTSSENIRITSLSDYILA